MGSVTKRFKNNMRARRMALNAGLRERGNILDEDGRVTGTYEVGVHSYEYRTPMIRMYRRFRRTMKYAHEKKRAHERAQEDKEPWWRKAGGSLNPFRNRGR